MTGVSPSGFVPDNPSGSVERPSGSVFFQFLLGDTLLDNPSS